MNSKSFGMSLRRYGAQNPLLYAHTSTPLVFVTGNANKLREVQQILAVGDSGIQVTNQALDGGSPSGRILTKDTHASMIVPEVQGSTQEVAIAKCRSAAQQVRKPPRTVFHVIL